MFRKNSISILSDKKWAEDFLQPRFAKYFPEAKKLIDIEIKVIKTFLDYQRIIVKYNLVLSGKNGDFKKSIIVKAERKNNSLKPVGTKIDYSINFFLEKNKLGDIIARPLEYYNPLQAFFCETIEGECLKQISANHQSEKFINFIPMVAEAVQKIHCLKNKGIIIKNQLWENRQQKIYLSLIKKHYPFGLKRFKNLILFCRDFKIKNRKDFSGQDNHLIHGDLHSGNIFTTEQKIKIIDFSEAGVADPLYDLGYFFIHTELMFEYDFHQNYQEMIEKVKSLFCQNYFQRQPSDSEKKRISYYALNNLCHIISYASINEQCQKKQIKTSDLMEKLIKIGEEKLKKYSQ